MGQVTCISSLDSIEMQGINEVLSKKTLVYQSKQLPKVTHETILTNHFKNMYFTVKPGNIIDQLQFLADRALLSIMVFNFG